MGAAPKLHYKRKHERHPVRLKAKVRPIGKREWSTGNLINLSQGGMCLESQLGYFVGQMIELMVPKEDGADSHFITAIVVWKRGSKHGLNFL
jgi:hypothetical protein